MVIEQNQWAVYFKDFNRRNRWRPSRLVAFDEIRGPQAKDVMPLVGISLDEDREGSTRIHIMLGTHDTMALRHQTYTITGVERVTPQCGPDGEVDTLEIEDEQGVTSLLHFELLPVGFQPAEQAKA